VKAPPRLIARTLAVTFVTVAVILSVVFIVLTLETRERVRTSEIEKLAASEAVYKGLEERRQQDQLGIVATLAENPTLKAALDTYFTEIQFGSATPEDEAAARRTVAQEAAKLAAVTDTDIVAILDRQRRVFASAGGKRDLWGVGDAVDVPDATQTAF